MKKYKIAISLSGQPYFYAECIDSFLTNLYTESVTNTYGHFWWDSSYTNKCFKMHYNCKLDSSNSPELAKDRFKIKNVQIERHKNYDLSFFKKFNNVWTGMSLEYYRMMTPIFLYGYLCQTESIFKSVSSIENEEITIRTRLDIIYAHEHIVKIINKINIEDNTIYFQTSGNGGHLFAGEPPNVPCDWFYLGKSTTIKKFTSLLSDQVYEKFKNGIVHMRDYIINICEENKINYKLIDFGAVLFKQTNLFNKANHNPIELYSDNFHQGDMKPQNLDIWPYWIENINFKHFKDIT